ncbi:hypothetical protein HK098_006417 [Nowakowskiella sp. JEL0407]|nr:hypothetical protein HK098_006417 [Nowakowskiella sp. JEL0407]
MNSYILNHYLYLLLLALFSPTSSQPLSNVPPPVPPSPPPPDANLTIELSPQSFSGIWSPYINPSAGISFEWSDVTKLFGGPNGFGINNASKQLFANLEALVGNSGRPVLRIGGNSATKMKWSGWTDANFLLDIDMVVEVTPAILNLLDSFCSTVGTQAVLQVSMLSNDTKYAIEFFTNGILANIKPENILAVGIGNEPDHFEKHGFRPPGYTFQDYLAEFLNLRQLLGEAAGSTQVDFMAPSFAGEWRNASYDIDFRKAVNSTVKYHSIHKYALRGCSKNDVTFENLLRTPIPSDIYSDIDPLIPLATDGVKIAWAEGSTTSCSGRDGLSNTFAAAIWTVDALLELTYKGVSEYFLSGSQQAWYALYNSKDGKTVTVFPPYYGLYMFYMLTGGPKTKISRVTHLQGEPETIKIWLIQNESTDPPVSSIFIIHKEIEVGEVVVRTVPFWNSTRAQIVRFTADAPEAKDGITIAGRTFDGTTDGNIVGDCRTEIVEVQEDGYLEISVDWLTAALVVPENVKVC